MDGHDENMDGVSSGQNSQPVPPVTPINTNDTAQNNASTLPGVIVSTPNMAAPQIYNAADYIDHPAGLGDIKIRGEKKNKKWLWILLAVVAGVAVVAAVVWAVMAFLIPKELTLKESFNAYANYFLYGTESTDDIEGSYEYGSTYYLANIDLSEGQVEEHFKKSEEKYREFLEKFNKAIEKQPDLVSDETKKWIEGYFEKLDSYYRSTIAPVLGYPAIYDMYFDEAAEKVKDYVKEYYDFYSRSEVEGVRQRGSDLINGASGLVTALRTFDTAGCILDTGINYECQVDGGSASLKRANKLLQDYSELVSTIEETESSNRIQVYRNIWIIKKGL